VAQILQIALGMRRTISLVFLTSVLSTSVSAQVSGTVVDDETGQPIAGAVVSVQATDIETSTDESGAFELTEASGSGLVVVAGAKGYFYASSTESTPASGVELRASTRARTPGRRPVLHVRDARALR
jgi:hypothetical protein